MTQRTRNMMRTATLALPVLLGACVAIPDSGVDHRPVGYPLATYPVPAPQVTFYYSSGYPRYAPLPRPRVVHVPAPHVIVRQPVVVTRPPVHVIGGGRGPVHHSSHPGRVHVDGRRVDDRARDHRRDDRRAGRDDRGEGRDDRGGGRGDRSGSDGDRRSRGG